MLKIEKKGDEGALNADDLAALNSSTHSGLARFTKVNMEKVALEEGASVSVMSLSGAQYMALPHGTSIADMKALGSNCTNLKAVAATNVAPNPTEFTGYSWAAGEIYNICQLEPRLIEGIEKGICANTMQKLTIGGNVDDRDASTLSASQYITSEKDEFKNGASATYFRDGQPQNCAVSYLAPSHSGGACSPWMGGTEIELDFTEAIFANKGDLALVSYNTKELLLPIDPTFTEIKPNMFANLSKLRHIIIPNNIVTIGDAAFYCNGQTYLTEALRVSINHNKEVPPFTEWLFEHLRKEMSRAYQELFWRGDTASNNKELKAVDGIEKKLAADANVIQITGSTITTQNVIAQVEAAVMKAIDAAATAEVSLDTHKVFMNKNDVKYLEIALGNRLYQDLNSEGLQFKNWGKSGNYFTVYGFQVMPTEQSRSTIIVAPEKCLTLGTDVFDAHTTIKIVDMMDTNLDDVVRGRIITNLGTAILFPELIAYSHV